MRELAKIANKKHTIGIKPRFEIGGYKFRAKKITFSGNGSLVTPKWDPKTNDVILRTQSKPFLPQGEYEFEVFICLDVPGILQGKPALPLLLAFIEKAEKVYQDMYHLSSQLMRKNSMGN